MNLNLNDKFMLEISKSNIIGFMGLAKYLKVPVRDNDGALRNFEDIFSEVMGVYNGFNRTKKRDTLKLLHQVNLEAKNLLKEEPNANNTGNRVEEETNNSV